MAKGFRVSDSARTAEIAATAVPQRGTIVAAIGDHRACGADEVSFEICCSGLVGPPEIGTVFWRDEHLFEVFCIFKFDVPKITPWGVVSTHGVQARRVRR